MELLYIVTSERNWLRESFHELSKEIIDHLLHQLFVEFRREVSFCYLVILLSQLSNFVNFYHCILGGVLANSLAIATDAAHLLTDFASFMISLFAIYLASRPATKTMSFGWHRAGRLNSSITFLQSTTLFWSQNFIP